MAIWQYSFTIIPKDSILNDSVNPIYNDDGLFEDDIYWIKRAILLGFFDGMEKIIPYGESWSKDLLVFGDLESNCMEVYSEKGYVISASFRIDFRNNYESFLRRMLEYIESKGLIILDEKKNKLSTNFLLIKKTIEDSPQFAKYTQLGFSSNSLPPGEYFE
jgi:hypothetical protein